MKSRKKNHRNLKSELINRGKRISGKTGLPPGSLVHIGKVLTDSVTVRMTEFNKDLCTFSEVKDLESLRIQDSNINRWIEIKGLHETKIIESIGEILKISPLVLEDILNTEHRPKYDILDGMLFLTLKAFTLTEKKEIQVEQASFILGKGFLISFQESNHTWFEPVKSSLVNPSGRIRLKGLDYLLYALIDVIIDRYYEVIESIGDLLEDLEERIFENPGQELIEKNRLIKKGIINIRKALIPALEAINKLKRDEPELIDNEEIRYFNDIHDHIVQLLDYLDTYRELSAEIKENYLSNISLRMNQVMKLLAIITTIFIPLTFIAGIYGMNFINMPELAWKYGYFAVLGLMLVIMITMLVYFRIKKWI